MLCRGWQASRPGQGSFFDPPGFNLDQLDIFEGGCCTLGLPDYFPLYVVMLWLRSVAKNILPEFFFTFEVSSGLISHLCRLRPWCQRADSARSLSPLKLCSGTLPALKTQTLPTHTFPENTSFLWIDDVSWD